MGTVHQLPSRKTARRHRGANIEHIKLQLMLRCPILHASAPKVITARLFRPNTSWIWLVKGYDPNCCHFLAYGLSPIGSEGDGWTIEDLRDVHAQGLVMDHGWRVMDQEKAIERELAMLKEWGLR